MNDRYRVLALALFLLTGAGCSAIPRDIADGPESSPSVEMVQSDPSGMLGTRVRWGGSIVQTTNIDDTTRIEVVSRPLLANARPSAASDRSDGRFIVEIHGFMEPEIYKAGRLLTIVGTVEAVETGKVGEQDYRFPLISAESHYLWEVRRPYSPYYPYGYYDPWYSDYRWHRYPPCWPHCGPPRRSGRISDVEIRFSEQR